MEFLLRDRGENALSVDSLNDFRLDSRTVNFQGRYRWDFVVSVLLEINESLV